MLSEKHKHNPKQVNKTSAGKRKLLMAFFVFMEIRELKNITSKNILVDILLKKMTIEWK